MRKVKMNIVSTVERNVPMCPYCGTIPMIEVNIKTDAQESDSVWHEKATCPRCGLSAPLKVWDSINDALDASMTEK